MDEKSIRVLEFHNSFLQQRFLYATDYPSQLHGVISREYTEKALVEAIGWLVEGVFCGYFDTHSSNTSWNAIQPASEIVSKPKYGWLIPHLKPSFDNLRGSMQPFRSSLQMQAGPQQGFESPLFPHALTIAFRMSRDDLASFCSNCIQDMPDGSWNEWKNKWTNVRASEIAGVLSRPIGGPVSADITSLAAGYLRLLEHIYLWKEFFETSKHLADKSVDFDSFCQRIGGLTLWRLPLHETKVRERFNSLYELIEFALRPELSLIHAPWSTFDENFRRYFHSLLEAWDKYHVASALATA